MQGLYRPDNANTDHRAIRSTIQSLRDQIASLEQLLP
jgi:hypothetical protein